jgi:hypothetical protein
VPGAATGHDADLAAERRVGTDERTPIVGGCLQHVGVRDQQAFEHLVDERVRVINELLHLVLLGRR